METETRVNVKLKNGKEVWVKAQPIPYFHREGLMSRVFGLVSKKKLVREMVNIYVENDTDGDLAFDTNMVYYCMGNSNALDGLASSLGIDLRPYIRTHKELLRRSKKTEPPKEEARITVTCTKCPCKGACDELPEDMSCEDVLAYYAIEPPKEEA